MSMTQLRKARFMKARIGAQKSLVAGGVGVLPTDTIYGLVGSALRRRTVERIYRLRRRDPRKPVIILVASPKDVRRFGVRLQAGALRVLKRAWPGKVSVILPLASGARGKSTAAGRGAVKKFEYLHRGTKTLAFRLPRPAWLRQLLVATGPLVAPSANTEGAPPAATIREAKKYFGRRADFYLDAGRLAGEPSTLIAVKNGRTTVLRQGAAKILGATRRRLVY